MEYARGELLARKSYCLTRPRLSQLHPSEISGLGAEKAKGRKMWGRKIGHGLLLAEKGKRRRKKDKAERGKFDFQRPRRNVQRSIFNAQRATHNVQRSTFNAQLSAFNFQRAIYNAGKAGANCEVKRMAETSNPEPAKWHGLSAPIVDGLPLSRWDYLVTGAPRCEVCQLRNSVID